MEILFDVEEYLIRWIKIMPTLYQRKTSFIRRNKVQKFIYLKDLSISVMKLSCSSCFSAGHEGVIICNGVFDCFNLIFLGRFGMFYPTKKLWTLWHLLHGLLLLASWLKQLLRHGGQNSHSVRLMIVPQFASSWIQIQVTSWHRRQQPTSLSSHLYLVRMELEWKLKNSSSSAFVPCLFPSLAGFIEKVGNIVLQLKELLFLIFLFW